MAVANLQNLRGKQTLESSLRTTRNTFEKKTKKEFANKTVQDLFFLNNTEMKDRTKHDTTKHDATKNDATKNDATKHDATKHDATKNDATKHDATKRDTRDYNKRLFACLQNGVKSYYYVREVVTKFMLFTMHNT